MHVWSPEQLRAFLAQVRHDPLYAAWLLFATTGMRRGEVAGLRWPCELLSGPRGCYRRCPLGRIEHPAVFASAC